MMFVARWIIEVRNGKKPEFLELMKEWFEIIGTEIGVKPENRRIVMGSIGALESRFEFDVTVESLAELEEIWAKMTQSEAFVAMQPRLAPTFTEKSSRWEIFRVIDL